MPTLSVAKNFILGLIGKPHFSDNEFEELCLKFGVELDDITSEKEMYMREQGEAAATGKQLSSEVIYKIDTPANRYDLLSAEGMSVALNVFQGAMALPAYTVLNRGKPLYRMVVEKSVKKVRDYVVCAVLRDVKFNEWSYNSFIDFQDKLHSGLARRRTLASVGTHDLDKIGSNEFLYAARPKETIQFVPLRHTKVLDCSGDGLEKFYADDRHINKFVPLISGLSNYPVIMDGAEKQVLSLPPIINSSFSAISPNTKNIFIECTAPDHYRARVLVNQLVCAFSMYCAKPFTVEAVQVDYEEEAQDGTKSIITPLLETQEQSMSIQRLNSIIGVNMKDGQECSTLLKKMMYDVARIDGDTVVVNVPAVRSDVLGPPDVMEDVAISYGYDNIKYTECITHGAVTQTPLSKVSHLMRIEMASAGYNELLTFSMCSREDAFESLDRQDRDVAVHIANPKTIEFQVCRPSLLPGFLKTLNANKSQALPLRFFECADVVLIDNTENFPPILEVKDVLQYPSPGARNQRRLAALHCSSNSSSFENIHGLTEYAMMKLGIPRQGAEPEGYTGDSYSLQGGSDGAFFPGRAMDIFLHRRGEKVKIGGLGVIHPNTLKAYDVPHPCSYMEVNIQFLCTNE